MESIIIRYGESVTLPIDTADATAVSAAIYIGRPGQPYVLTNNISLTAGKGTFVLTSAQTQIPLGTYYYQINVTDALGYVEKYPTPGNADCIDCGTDFPEFIVSEALDEIEVS